MKNKIVAIIINALMTTCIVFILVTTIQFSRTIFNNKTHYDRAMAKELTMYKVELEKGGDKEEIADTVIRKFGYYDDKNLDEDLQVFLAKMRKN